MQNSFRRSLSLLPCLVALALLPAPSAKADTIFDVSGSAENVSGGNLGSCANNATCPFSGTFTVDTTSTTTNPLGTVDAVDITFPGLIAFNTVASQISFPTFGWQLNAENSSMNVLSLLFTTTPTTGSLVGFTGGTMLPSSVFETPDQTVFIYVFNSGTIAPVPEPSSLGILSVALLAFAGIIGLRKRKPVVTTRST